MSEEKEKIEEIRPEILKIRNAKTEKEMYEIINEMFPDLIIAFSNKYSDDYQYLTDNWNKICKIFKTTPKKIVLFNVIDNEDPKSPQNKLCDELTNMGYVIRRNNEFFLCDICNSAIPVKDLFKRLRFFKAKSDFEVKIPDIWSKQCSSC